MFVHTFICVVVCICVRSHHRVPMCMCLQAFRPYEYIFLPLSFSRALCLCVCVCLSVKFVWSLCTCVGYIVYKCACCWKAQVFLYLPEGVCACACVYFRGILVIWSSSFLYVGLHMMMIVRDCVVTHTHKTNKAILANRIYPFLLSSIRRSFSYRQCDKVIKTLPPLQSKHCHSLPLTTGSYWEGADVLHLNSI